jgi:hypothetical protein
VTSKKYFSVCSFNVLDELLLLISSRGPMMDLKFSSNFDITFTISLPVKINISVYKLRTAVSSYLKKGLKQKEMKPHTVPVKIKI